MFDLPGRQVRLLGVKDVEKLITDPTDEDKVPCWAEIWPAARGLSQWIWENINFDGVHLLELGAGLGLPGIVCGIKGAQVTFSDFNSSALDLVRLNANRNGLHNFYTYLGDWRDFKLAKKFPWVIGSDIFYDTKLNIYLKELIPRLASGGGNLLIAHPGRPASFAFVEELGAVAPLDEKRWMVPITIDDPFFPYYEIHIHHIRFNS
ncbi:class I SAM-dependent methyltransferase [Desulfoscipio gibsoniae]|uniref:Putative methyltransferase n=1 Tax=Desulfoscipio gibsoniae DSM 7213 TaxID=767817 RepID=R4KMT1_9FIRM|nr:methyltransferase [Desulfoscipio gibsoniae]AGL01855.1 putative methyltransferase [Desulfoscipio gibsoniae DSM 7213]